MTDNEIMTLEKSLFILRHGSAEGEHKYFEAIDVIEKEINRQEAEIERLNETLDDILDYLPACTDCEGKTPLGERTEKCVYDIDQTYCGKKATELFFKMENELKTAKAEAVKEFAERVKSYIDVGHLRPPTEICFSELDVVNIIDKLVKEMVGDK